MEELFSSGYTQIKFIPYTTAHLVVLGVFFLLCAFLFLLDKLPKKYQTIFRYTLVIIMLLIEISWHINEWYFGYWKLKYGLPLHLCSVTLYMAIFSLARNNTFFYNFLFFLGICGAGPALFIPNTIYGFPHFRFWHFFIFHGGIILATLYMTVVEKNRPQLSSIIPIVITMNIYIALVGVINFYLESNYLFLCENARGTSFLGPWPWHILGMEIMMITLFFVIYIPFFFTATRKTNLNS
ncbi:TIGR02206 family membrane protein [Candidatus Uabimicrobium sp. HlEnr_7]|uniref:YwaF family protein n=1 Tax=Candidatus Uabimicrobium helgolandensis TaxID=3095367 RepID=UPI0035590196